jgi:predicted O-methyltransferase YrrM
MPAVNPALNTLLTELERFGETNDSQAPEHAQRMLNITRDTGEFLHLLIRAMRSTRVLEIGTSNGYSTLWLAEAVRPLGGTVQTVEKLLPKQTMALANFSRAGLAGLITSHLADAGTFLAAQPDSTFDFIFLDSQRSEYVGWSPDLHRILLPGGVLVVDNAVSHPHEMADFMATMRSAAGWTSALVPVGKGEFVALKERSY